MVDVPDMRPTPKNWPPSSLIACFFGDWPVAHNFEMAKPPKPAYTPHGGSDSWRSEDSPMIITLRDSGPRSEPSWIFLQPGTCPEGQGPGKTLGAQERCRPRWRRWQWWTPAWTIIDIFNINVNMNSLLFVWNFHLAVGICLVSTRKFLRGANDSRCQVCLTAFACQTRPEEFFQKFQWLWFGFVWK